MKIPTKWMVQEMETDVAMMGYSRFTLDDTIYEMKEDGLTITRETPNDLNPMEIVALVKPFFDGQPLNVITNHHDGTYTVAF